MTDFMSAAKTGVRIRGNLRPTITSICKMSAARSAVCLKAKRRNSGMFTMIGGV